MKGIGQTAYEGVRKAANTAAAISYSAAGGLGYADLNDAAMVASGVVDGAKRLPGADAVVRTGRRVVANGHNRLKQMVGAA